MWPFSETNAAAMRTLKIQATPNRQCETKDQQGVTIALTLSPKPPEAPPRVRGLINPQAWPTSALARITDSSRTSRQVQKVPIPEEASFDQLVGAGEQRRRNFETNSLRCLRVDYEFEILSVGRRECQWDSPKTPRPPWPLRRHGA
jgi:hypothetical protein